jgi:hypothetical protein
LISRPFLCHFVPGPGWEVVRSHFESWAALHGPDPDGTRTMQVIKPIMDLGLTLVADDDSQPMALFKECIVRIDGASLACATDTDEAPRP